MLSVGFPSKFWRLRLVCLQNKNVRCDINCDSLLWARGLQFTNSCRHVPVCLWVATEYSFLTQTVYFLAGSITPDTNLVLINVLYFNSKWRKEFNKNVESKTLFKLQNNPRNTIKADYMFGELSARYFRTPLNTEIVSLPFEDENYSMVFVIPQNGKFTDT